MKNADEFGKFLASGLTFTSLVVAPVIIFVFFGSYIVKKFNLSDGVMVIFIILMLISIIFNMIMFFAKKLQSTSHKDK